jgi:hypothetical protein
MITDKLRTQPCQILESEHYRTCRRYDKIINENGSFFSKGNLKLQPGLKCHYREYNRNIYSSDGNYKSDSVFEKCNIELHLK